MNIVQSLNIWMNISIVDSIAFSESIHYFAHTPKLIVYLVYR